MLSRPAISCPFAVLLFGLLLVSADPSLRAELTLDIDFPGGSGVLTEHDSNANHIRVDPSDHPGKGWRCWWYFRLDGLEAGKPLTVDIGEAPWATPDQAAFSYDRRDWSQTEPGKREGKRITYTLTPESETLWLAWGPPFVPADSAALVEELAGSCPGAEVFELCRTREGRSTPALRLRPERLRAEGGEEAGNFIWLQARQHAWESGSSWVASGLGRWLVSDDPAAVALRAKTEIVLVPVMDIDNVARGAGGKNQEPQDHNRDWSDKPHWNAVAAAQKEMLAADAEGRLVLFVDLHNPGANDRMPFFYIPPRESMPPIGRRNLDAFVRLSSETVQSPLRITTRTRESGPGYDKRWRTISKNWVDTHCAPHVVAVTLETSWNTPASHQAGYEQVGRRFGQAIARYLEKDPRRPVEDESSAGN